MPDYTENIIHIGTTGRTEHRRRRYELLAACALIIIVFAITWVQLTFYGVDSWVFIVLLNINSIFMLIVLFLVARNIVKLILERRRKVFGVKMRTRLVLIFVSLSLIPTVIMFLASNRVVATGVDYWFTKKTESSLQAALEVGQSFYVASAERLKARSEAILAAIRHGGLLWGGNAMDVLMQEKQKEYGLTLVGVITPQGIEQNWHGPEAIHAIWDKIKKQVDLENVATGAFGSLLWAVDNADYVFGVLAVDKGKTGYLITAESIGHGLLTKLDRISTGFEEYANLKQLKKPLKISFLLILGILALIIVFGSVWFGFRLSKEITAPILALANGTRRIAQGELDFRLEDKGQDELGLLIDSFNIMARDLQQGQANLTKVNTLLAQQKNTLEERNRYIETVLDNITTGVLTLDVYGYILLINKAACSIFATSPKLLRGKRPDEFLPQKYKDIFYNMLESLSKHPELHWKTQEDFILGNRHWKLIIHAIAISGMDGIHTYLIVVDDITELEKMQRMAAWREVARRIAHEIKNPLTPIKLSAQRLDKKFGMYVHDPIFKQCTDIIVKQVERLQEMVQEFSAFAKLPEVRLVSGGNLSQLLLEVVELFRHSHSKIEWAIDISESMPEILMDTAALNRVFVNVITNALEILQHEPESREKYIGIVARYDELRKALYVNIHDSGPGLPPEEREHIFEPYFSRKKGGTGLGLAIAKAIIADHNGYINALPSPYGGLNIEMVIPIAEIHT